MVPMEEGAWLRGFDCKEFSGRGVSGGTLDLSLMAGDVLSGLSWDGCGGKVWWGWFGGMPGTK